MQKLKDIVPSPSLLRGVKAVWARTEVSALCFASRGNSAAKDKLHFVLASGLAEAVVNNRQPYAILIGGGAGANESVLGRVLSLVRCTGVYGETSAFVQDRELLRRLQQWPVAVVVSETYSFVDEPHLVSDLGFDDRSILSNAYDAVIRRDGDVERLWDALAEHSIQRHLDISPPPDFYDDGRVQLCSTLYPRHRYSAEEGKRRKKIVLEAEACKRLRAQALSLNLARFGKYTCEACSFHDDLPKMFDAHHTIPLAVGVRETRSDDLVILCPTCHRTAHAKGEDWLKPLPLASLKQLRMPTPQD